MSDKEDFVLAKMNTVDDEYNIAPIDKDGYMRFKEVPEPNFDMYYYAFDEKKIKKIERMVRSSYEYREYIRFLKLNLNVDHCSFYKGYGMKYGLTIELHHSPFTLYNITEAVVNKSLHFDNRYGSFLTAEIVNSLHYAMKVGLVPLNPTAHKLVHSGKLEVHPSLVLNYWKQFYEEYKAFLSEDAICKYNRATELATSDKMLETVPEILEYKPAYIDNNTKLLTSEDFDKLCIESKMQKLEAM